MIRNIILLITFFTVQVSYAQKDETYFFLDLTPGVMVNRFNEITELKDYNSSYGFKRTESTAIYLTGIGHFGLNVPFYRTETKSVGMKVSIGLGTALAVKGDDRYTGLFILDMPQFLYFRNVTKDLDFSILTGYKFTHLEENFTQQFLLGVEFAPGFESALRIYGTPFGYKLYREYSTGRLEPVISYHEFGFGLVLGF